MIVQSFPADGTAHALVYVLARECDDHEVEIVVLTRAGNVSTYRSLDQGTRCAMNSENGFISMSILARSSVARYWFRFSTPTTVRAWLQTLSRFYSYSFNNWLLICAQRPDATRIAGFQRWKSLGRFVKKGERGIRIFAPILRKVEEEKNGTTEQVSRPVGFRSIAVFALEQTDGEPLPEIDSNATEGGEELLPRLEVATAALGIKLIYKAIPGAAEGLSKGELIEIEETLSTAARCGVIAHELAHEILHKQHRYETTCQQRELEAESVSYTVLAHYGIHTKSRFYLASYDVTAEMLGTSLQTITQTAKRIISTIADNEKTTEDADESSALSSIAA